MIEHAKRQKALVGVGALIALILASQIIIRASAMPSIAEDDVPDMEEKCRAFGKEKGKDYQLLIGTLADYKISPIAIDFCMNTDPVCSARKKAKVAALMMTVKDSNLHPNDKIEVSHEAPEATLETLSLREGQRYAMCAYSGISINGLTLKPDRLPVYRSDFGVFLLRLLRK